MQRARSIAESPRHNDEEDPGGEYDSKKKGGAGRKVCGLCCLATVCWVFCVVAAGLDAAAQPPPPPPPPRPPVDPAQAAAAVKHLQKRAYGPAGGLDHDAWRRGSGKAAHVPPVAPPQAPQQKPQQLWTRKKKTRKEKDMPIWEAPRLDPLLHKRKLGGPLDEATCQAHKRAIPFHQRALEKIRITRTDHAPTVLCIIYTYTAHHAKNARTAANTWLPRCDGAVILSDASDDTEGIVGVPHEGKEEYSNIWQKQRSNWRYVYEHYRHDFDYFHIGGDDTFVLADNLRTFLARPELVQANAAGQPLYLGRRMKVGGNANHLFNTGGAGYVFNQAALALLYDSLDEPFCAPHRHGFYEDVLVADCFKNGPAHLLPIDTRDATGAERFHMLSPGQHLSYRKAPKDWVTTYSFDLLEGLAYFSPESTVFHYCEPALVEHMDALLHRCRG